MDTSSVSYIQENVFTEGLKSPEYVEILLTSIKSVQEQIQQTLNSTNKLKDKQIKIETRLQECNISIR